MSRAVVQRWGRRAAWALVVLLLAAHAGFAQPNLAGGSGGYTSVGRPQRTVTSISIQDITRIGGQGEFPLRGMGIVIGLNGTGDSGGELAVAQPLAALYERSGNPIPDLAALGKAKSAAIVWVDCVVPESGAREDDKLDVRVSAAFSAKSLKGGRLIICPLTEIRPDNPDIYAFAMGSVQLEDPGITTSGVIRGGAQMARPVRKKISREAVDLIVRPYYRSFSTTRVLAAEINGLRANLEEPDNPVPSVAYAVDDTTVRVVIPPEERADPTNFLASILTKPFSPDLLDLPAQVVINTERNLIVITGDVEISAVTVGSERLQVSLVEPPRPITPENPAFIRDEFAELGTTARQSEKARIQDLLDALRALNVPFEDQVALLEEIHKAGRLYARLVRE